MYFVVNKLKYLKKDLLIFNKEGYGDVENKNKKVKEIFLNF